MADYVLVSPDGNEHPTSSIALRTRLLAQGYVDTQAPPGEPTVQSPHPPERQAKSGPAKP